MKYEKRNHGPLYHTSATAEGWCNGLFFCILMYLVTLKNVIAGSRLFVMLYLNITGEINLFDLTYNEKFNWCIIFAEGGNT